MVADRYGSGPAVVLLHGQPGSARVWSGVVPLLCDRFALLVPDRPGYGRTGGAAGGFTDNAGALIALLDSAGVERAILVGHSWGGGVALAAAEEFPGRVAALVLAASVGPGENVTWIDRVLAAPLIGDAIAALTLGVVGGLLNAARLRRSADRHLSGRPHEALRDATGMTGATGAGVWRSFVVEQRAYVQELEGLAGGLRRIQVPVAVVHGTHDRTVAPHVGEQLSGAIPGATHTAVADAHHYLPHEHPEVIAAAVEEVARRSNPTRLERGA